MDAVDTLEFARRAIILLLELSLPILLIALVVGFVISMVQALTQIQEPTLSFVPKIIAVFGSLIFLMPYMGNKLAVFSEQIMNYIIQLG